MATRMQQQQAAAQQQEEQGMVDNGPDLYGTRANMGGKKVVAKEMMGGNDDDWGNEALGDDLLPM